MKTFRKISTKDYLCLNNGELWLCTTPQILPDTATIESIVEYHKTYHNQDVDTSDAELIDVEVKEVNKTLCHELKTGPFNLDRKSLIDFYTWLMQNKGNPTKINIVDQYLYEKKLKKAGVALKTDEHGTDNAVG